MAGVLIILSLLMGFASISTDLYLPAMPAIGASFGTKAGMIEWTISGYLVGFSLGQLLWGPLGDRYGRLVPVALGLALFAIGSAGCALAGSAWAMIGWRVVQAVGACAGVVLARAMVRDLYTGNRAAQMMSTLMTVMAIAPLLGPTVGGQILALGSWRAIFWTLVGVGLATLALLLALPETLPANGETGSRSGRRWRITGCSSGKSGSWAMPERALFSMVECLPTSRARRSPTSAIITCRRKRMACSLGSASWGSWRRIW
ncbi:MAG: MFS transporter [Chthoniobacteraceae bacterium]